MEIIVCVKQVPGTSQVAVDPETGVLQRDGIEAKLNPYDLYAVELALRLRKMRGGHVTAISMGPAQARQALLETLCMGADRGILISDRRFAGSDVLATSRTIAQGIKASGPYDLVVCGKQTTDGDTAQVGPEISEFLQISCAGNVTEICEIDDQQITVLSVLDRQVQKLQIPFPCLISADKDINTPRLPSLKTKKYVEDGQICVMTLDSLDDKDEKHYGLAGSATQVCRIFPPEKNIVRNIHMDDDPAESIFRLLAGKKLI
jgi:electron transfer flavoprotein beta subunit